MVIELHYASYADAPVFTKQLGDFTFKSSQHADIIIANALEDLTKGSENPGSRSFLRILIGI